VNLKAMWQSGASYEELHRVNSPHSRCECDYCEMMRCLEEWDDWAWTGGFALAQSLRNEQ